MSSPSSDLSNLYTDFCRYRSTALQTKMLDLTSITFFHPTLLLPLGILISDNPNISVTKPTNPGLLSYYEMMTEKKIYESGKTYIPILVIPYNEDPTGGMFYNFVSGSQYEYCGGMNTFAQVLNELTDNIYEHSKFSHAYIAAQSYPNLKYTEVTIVDDGISIPSSYEVNNISIKDDIDGLSKALNGLSTKSSERGFGLSTTLRVLREALNSECLIISRGAELVADKDHMKMRSLPQNEIFNGTLISARIPYSLKKVNYYDYAE